ncbi:MAG: ChaB family protein [Desulfobulbaceae bacterium]|jgi:cation transport regulator|nr:ChaB family protein [Desulfobulbaceae bacterium]
MPYGRNRELPAQVRDNLPEAAQTIYRKSFNSAWNQYDSPEKRRGKADREETAHRVAWSAVKQAYEKGDSGTWRRKSH